MKGEPRSLVGPARRGISLLRDLRLRWFHGGGGRFPDFLGIGAQKAGTTWLYENLRCHEGAYLPGSKELAFPR